MRNWQNAQDEQTRSNSGISEDTAGSNRGVDGGRTQDVNAVQRRGSVGENNLAPVRVGEAVFTGASGPVGNDGAPMVIYHGTKDTVTAFDVDHPNRHARGWLGTKS